MNWKLAWTIAALIIVTTGVIVSAILALRDRDASPTYLGWRVEMWNIQHGYRMELHFENNVIIGRTNLRNYIVDNYPAEIDPSISREHCILFDQGDVLLVWNMSTVNPMSINGYRVNTPVRIRPGDKMEMGKSTFLITRVDRTAM